MLLSACRVSGVNRNRGARDEAGLVAREPEAERHDFLGTAEPLDDVLLLPAVEQRGAAARREARADAVRHRLVDHPGAERVDADLRSELQRRRLGEHDEAAL